MPPVPGYCSNSCLNITSCLKDIKICFGSAQISSPVPTFEVLTYPDNLKVHLKPTENSRMEREGGDRWGLLFTELPRRKQSLPAPKESFADCGWTRKKLRNEHHNCLHPKDETILSFDVPLTQQTSHRHHSCNPQLGFPWLREDAPPLKPLQFSSPISICREEIFLQVSNFSEKNHVCVLKVTVRAAQFIHFSSSVLPEVFPSVYDNSFHLHNFFTYPHLEGAKFSPNASKYTHAYTHRPSILRL